MGQHVPVDVNNPQIALLEVGSSYEWWASLQEAEGSGSTYQIQCWDPYLNEPLPGGPFKDTEAFTMPIASVVTAELPLIRPGEFRVRVEGPLGDAMVGDVCQAVDRPALLEREGAGRDPADGLAVLGQHVPVDISDMPLVALGEPFTLVVILEPGATAAASYDFLCYDEEGAATFGTGAPFSDVAGVSLTPDPETGNVSQELTAVNPGTFTVRVVLGAAVVTSRPMTA